MSRKVGNKILHLNAPKSGQQKLGEIREMESGKAETKSPAN